MDLRDDIVLKHEFFYKEQKYYLTRIKNRSTDLMQRLVTTQQTKEQTTYIDPLISYPTSHVCKRVTYCEEVEIKMFQKAKC